MTTCITYRGTEYEVEYDVERASGDGWNEPRYAACVLMTACEPDCGDDQEAIEELIERGLGI